MVHIESVDIDQPINESIAGNGKAPRQRIPEGESREEKFVRLAIHRMNAMPKRFRGLRNLKNYPHTEQQAIKIVDELKRQVAEVEAALMPREPHFRF